MARLYQTGYKNVQPETFTPTGLFSVKFRITTINSISGQQATFKMSYNFPSRYGFPKPFFQKLFVIFFLMTPSSSQCPIFANTVIVQEKYSLFYVCFTTPNLSVCSG